MSTTVDTNEKNWNTLQKQLTANRKQKNRITPRIENSMKTKQDNNINKEQKLIRKSILTNVNDNIANNYSKVVKPPQTPVIKDAGSYTNFYSPQPPSTQQQQQQQSQSHLVVNTPSKLNDPFGINPLPSIRSPFQSARDPFLQHPNLESWGVSNQMYDSFHFNPSPYLPVYNNIKNSKKQQKTYLIAPKFRRPLFQAPSPIMTDYTDTNSKLNYIAAKPYVRPDYESFEMPISTLQYSTRSYHKSLEQEHQESSVPLKSDQYLQDAHKMLKTLDEKKYDGKELFSTKFLEDLEYNFTPAVSSVKPKTSFQQKSTRPESRHHPAADEFIKNIKKQVNIIIPPRDYEDEPFLNTIAIDLAETIYKQEIEKFTRELVEQAINEEYNQVYLYQRPIFNHIFEETTSEMIRQLVTESVDEHRKQVEKFQANEIKKVAKEKLVTNLMLDHMLTKVAQHGRVMAENEDINKLMDGMILDVLLLTSMDVTKSRNKTLSNYPIKKFHMNSFMNVALDILVAELSSNLEEDMKELENYEQITSKI